MVVATWVMAEGSFAGPALAGASVAVVAGAAVASAEAEGRAATAAEVAEFLVRAALPVQTQAKMRC